jgi:hypothetical protein
MMPDGIDPGRVFQLIMPAGSGTDLFLFISDIRWERPGTWASAYHAYRD